MKNIEELLEIDTETMKVADLKKLCRELKGLVKVKEKQVESNSDKAKHLKYEGVSVVGKKCVKLRFDLETKEAVVESVEEFTQDVYNNAMAYYMAKEKLHNLATTTQQEEK
jgi:hypothetical protein